MQHDDAFLSLLSSQRELLSQLTMENRMRQAEMNRPAGGGYAAPPQYGYGPSPPRQPYYAQPADPMYMLRATNRGIDDYRLPDQRTNVDSYFSRRLPSVGMGLDQSLAPLDALSSRGIMDYSEKGCCQGKLNATFPRKSKFDDYGSGGGGGAHCSTSNERRLSFLQGFSLMDNDSEYDRGYSLKRDKLDDFSELPPANRSKKRRLSSLGLGCLSSTFFEDNLEEKPEERGDPMAVGGPVAGADDDDDDCGLGRGEPEIDEDVEQVIVDGDADSDDDEEEDTPEVETEQQQRAVPPKKKKTVKIEGCVIDADKLKESIEKFTKAMELSQKSQQAIHDWDRKMGLKRSHSKTMRQSSRSRKKLKTSLKKDMNSLSSKK